MEWVVLVTWMLVVGVALPLSSGVIAGNGWLGIQAMAALGGLALTVVYLFVGSGIGLIWVSVGLAGVGVLAVAMAAVVLTSPAVSSAGQTPDELHALLAGAALPLFGTVALLAMLLAMGIANVAVF